MSLKIMGLGLDYRGKLLFEAKDEIEFATKVVNSLERNVENIRKEDHTRSTAKVFRGEIERDIIDLGDPKSAGWTYLINANDPQRDEIESIIKPLAEHRCMGNPSKPLLFNNESPDEWFDWLNDNYFALELDTGKIPKYILIVGSPDQVPFRFQSILDSVANVGRVAFDDLDDLETYVKKLIRIETASELFLDKEALIFAPDGGLPDPTYFSRLYMAQPMTEHIRNKFHLTANLIEGNTATKNNLLNNLKGKRPALVYTASHGLGATSESFDFQKRYNGAICCQHQGSLTLEDLFTADDIPMNEPFLEGSAFFQFACFGYGTPAESDYTHWIEGTPKTYTEKDFVAALPKKLLAHPGGPIIFIGHLDTAFLHGFVDVESPYILDRWHKRIAPFVDAINQLLGVQPCGLAMQEMNDRYTVCNAIITNTYDRLRRGRLEWTDDLRSRFLNSWIIRSDAQNYMVFGDPAAHLRMPE
jgi:hypothetical protein